jgi:septum formation topological specificity factor MinE
MAQHFLSKISSLFGSSSATTSISSNASRSMARERLSVILASQRGSEILQGVDMVNFQKDVMEVVRVRKCVVLHTLQISLTLFLINSI